MYMIMFVLNDEKKTDVVLDAWGKAGVRGATLMDSTGAYRRRMRIPGRFAYATTSKDTTNITLFAVVLDEEIARNCLQETEKVIGDLSQPETGIFAYWELAGVKGIIKNFEAGSE